MKPVEVRLRERLSDEQIRCSRTPASTPVRRKFDPAFARELADELDLFVNDAFGSTHRAHASTVGVAELLLPAYAGLLLERELAAGPRKASRRCRAPVRPHLRRREGRGQARGVAQPRQADEVAIGGKMAEELRGESRWTSTSSCRRMSWPPSSPRMPRRSSFPTTKPRRLARPRHRARDAPGIRGRGRAR